MHGAWGDGERESDAHVERLREEARRARELRRKAPLDDAAAADEIARALCRNPEEYSLWNFRKERFAERVERYRRLNVCSEDVSVRAEEREQLIDMWKGELDLTMRAIRVHIKSYSSWAHRLWTLEQGLRFSPEHYASELERELALCSKILQRDARNFHAWVHRMFIRSRLRAVRPDEALEAALEPLREDLRVSTDCIEADFANYSAWHLRSTLLPRCTADSEVESVLRREIEWLRQAYYTDPSVESTWIYHSWLLCGSVSWTWRCEHQNSGSSERIALCFRVAESQMIALWTEELRSLEELDELEPETPRVLLAIAGVSKLLGDVSRARRLAEQLAVMDPLREQYYLNFV